MRHYVLAAGCLSTIVLGAGLARGEIALSQVILDMSANGAGRRDIEVANTSNSVIYVTVEPAAILNPGQANERRREDPDPQRLGLLATPNKLMIQPGEKKLVRFIALQPPGETDRIFRARVREVVGKVKAQTSALKVVIGYDVLVIQRPANAREALVADRHGDSLVFKNGGNTNVLLYDGRLCQHPDKNCRALTTKRIYAGGEWRVRLNGPGEVSYLVDNGNRTIRKSF